MDRICIPPELTIPHLLELEGVNPIFRDLLDALVDDFDTADYRSAIADAKRIRDLAEDQPDYHVAALASLLQAEALRCMQSWEDCLEMTLAATRWLDARLGPVASYNRGLAAYLEGLFHFIFGANKRALQAFSLALSALQSSKHHWSFESKSAKVVACEHLIGWIRDIRQCIVTRQDRGFVLILPVYESTDEGLNRIAARVVNLSDPARIGPALGLPESSLAKEVYGPNDGLRISLMDPTAEYFAIRRPLEQAATSNDREELLILRVVTKSSPSDAIFLAQHELVVRTGEGSLELRPLGNRSYCRAWIIPGGSHEDKPVIIIGGSDVAPNRRTGHSDIGTPESEHAQSQELLNMAIITLFAILAGANRWTDVGAFGKARLAWLSRFLVLPHGAPSAELFDRFFRDLDPSLLRYWLPEWMDCIRAYINCKRKLPDTGSSWYADRCILAEDMVYRMSAQAGATDLILGQRQLGASSSEATKIPNWLRVMDLRGSLVSIAATHTQKRIARQIVQQGGDYLLALRDDQPYLLEDIKGLFNKADEGTWQVHRYTPAPITHKGNGRFIETGECSTLSDPGGISLLRDRDGWINLRTVARVRVYRLHADPASAEDRYYISSLLDNGAYTAERIWQATCSHWTTCSHWITGGPMHWVLNVALEVDEVGERKSHAKENLTIFQDVALDLLRRDTRRDLDIHGKRLEANQNPDYLLQLLVPEGLQP
jgi:predicted transposase YbfD/YdcC